MIGLVLSLFVQQVRVELREEGSRFIIEGTTDLPEGSILSVSLSRPDGGLYDHEFVPVKDGRYFCQVQVFEGANPSGTYMARVRFAPQFQRSRKSQGVNREIAADGRLVLGTREDFEREHRCLCRRLRDEIDLMIRLVDEPMPDVEFARRAVLEIAARNRGRVIFQHFDLSKVSDEGLDRLAGLVTCALAEPSKTETFRREARALKSQLGLARASQEKIDSLADALQKLLDDAVGSEGAYRQGKLSKEELRSQASALLDTAQTQTMQISLALSDSSYERVVRLAEYLNEFFDRVGEGGSPDEPLKRLADLLAGIRLSD